MGDGIDVEWGERNEGRVEREVLGGNREAKGLRI